jgi:hypothetical protein
MTVRNSDASSGGWIVAVEPIQNTTPPSPYQPLIWPPPSGLEYNNYVDVEDSVNWQSGRPEIRSVEAVFDNLLKVTMGYWTGLQWVDMEIENSNNEIYTAITQTGISVGELLTAHNNNSVGPSIVGPNPKRLFLDVFIEAPSGHPSASNTFPGNLIRPSTLSGSFISPIDYRDVYFFYLLTTVQSSPTPIPGSITGTTPPHPRSSDYQPHTWRTDSVGTDTISSQQGTKAYSTDSKGHSEKTDGYIAIPGTEKPSNPTGAGGVAYFGTTIPNIAMPKGRLSAARGGTLSKAYDGTANFPVYDGTTDKMAPVLHTVKVGRASHSKPATTPYDAHNFFELRYSEPVNIGTGSGFSAASPTAVNVAADASFAAPSDHGGGISASGTLVNVAGYFQYNGQPVRFYDFNSTSPALKTVSPDRSSPTHDSLYRPDAWRLRIFLSGFAQTNTTLSTDTWMWPGWHTGIPEPVPAPRPPSDSHVTPALIPSPVILHANSSIKDTAATPNEFETYPVSGPNTLGTNQFSSFYPLEMIYPPDPLFPIISPAESDFTGRWDVDPPAFSFSELPDSSGFTPGTYSAECEIIPVSLDGGLTVTKLDFFIQDNSRENDFADANDIPLPSGTYEWEPFSGGAQRHPDNRPITTPPPPRAPRGVRDSTLWRPSGTSKDAFKIGIAASGSRVSSYNDNFESQVTHKYFLEGLNYNPNPTENDPYFSLHLTANPWNPDDAFILEYDHQQAYITDLAGNLLPSAGVATSLPLPAIDQIAPEVQITLAPVGENKLYIQFNEGLYYKFGSSRSLLSAGNFTLTGTASVSIDSSVPLKILQTSRTASPIPGVVKAVLTLSGPLTEQDVLTARINFAPDVCDYRGNPFTASGHAISDIALGIVEPLWASDGYKFDSSQYAGDSVSTLKGSADFTGKGRLHPSDIIMEARIKAPLISAPLSFDPDSAPLTLYYDANPKGFLGTDEVFSKMWLPLGAPGVVNAANVEARSSNPYSANGNLRDFLLPEADPENTGGSQMEFLYLLEAPDPLNPGSVRLMPSARYERIRDYDEYAADPLNLRPPFVVFPWSFQITAPIVQRGGVSIYNNVINPNRGEKALLTYTLSKGGMVTVNIFSLDGSLVYAMHRGSQAPGTYDRYWDGKNMGGRPVARGIYFVRVVGPGIDEIRKVMVVK